MTKVTNFIWFVTAAIFGVSAGLSLSRKIRSMCDDVAKEIVEGTETPDLIRDTDRPEGTP